MNVADLIAKAAERLGSEYKVAKAIDVTPQRLSSWKTGRQTCTAEDRALIADAAGIDPFAAMAEAIEERWAGTPKGERLRAVFSKHLQAVRNL